ncbi:LysR family transcriptional regulator [Microvirga brassicacearum]|uniref:LysR family transcriptional regulator n=1 Tax=Microvirga brassicacearum TaxID=2580413 RepID=A0A5N3P5X2_9HYPH|nr:LysR family transcriptional regulator [Microvirga brassicacearum]KAB0265128.1 LysR family transcriptional regulator [Microvirga brassicacearum]
MTPGRVRVDREQFVELSSLAVFAEIVHERSLTAAAKKVGLTQSAVSQVLKQIEVMVGVELIDRTARPLRVTPAGVRFQVYADSMLLEARKISAAVRQSAQAAFPKIRLGLTDSFASTFGPHIVPHLQSRAQQLTLRSSGINATIREALLGRELDLIVTTDPFDSVEGLERHELFRDPFLLVTPAEYSGLSIDGLRGLAHQLPLVRYSRRSSLGVHVDVHLRRLGLEPVDRFEMDSSDTLLSMVSAGPGWALTTALCLLHARHFVGKARLDPLPGPRTSRCFYLIARKEEHGDMPRQVARICRSVLLDTVLPEIQTLIPWVNKDLFIIETGTDIQADA